VPVYDFVRNGLAEVAGDTFMSNRDRQRSTTPRRMGMPKSASDFCEPSCCVARFSLSFGRRKLIFEL